jgi:hypothetical protein
VPVPSARGAVRPQGGAGASRGRRVGRGRDRHGLLGRRLWVLRMSPLSQQIPLEKSGICRYVLDCRFSLNQWRRWELNPRKIPLVVGWWRLDAPVLCKTEAGASQALSPIASLRPANEEVPPPTFAAILAAEKAARRAGPAGSPGGSKPPRSRWQPGSAIPENPYVCARAQAVGIEGHAKAGRGAKHDLGPSEISSRRLYSDPSPVGTPSLSPSPGAVRPGSLHLSCQSASGRHSQ